MLFSYLTFKFLLSGFYILVLFPLVTKLTRRAIDISKDFILMVDVKKIIIIKKKKRNSGAVWLPENIVKFWFPHLNSNWAIV